MSKKRLLPPLLDELLDSLNGPPTEAYRAEIDAAARHMAAGEGASSGGKKGAAKSAATRRGPGSKYAAILAGAAAYGGPEGAKVATIVRTLARQGIRVDESYVRRLLRNPGQ
jgi:hypothetical protein